jgi:UDP:flavonoid glycosyltransferase YjiC (YdhE family)
MRVLFSCTPGEGHYAPLLPLAHAFRERGDRVAFATAERTCERARLEGFEGLPAGLPVDELEAQFGERRAEIAALPPLERRRFVFAWRFAALDAPAKLDALLAAARAWRPDLIVHESADLAAPAVAASLGLPSVHHAFGRAIPQVCLDESSEALAELWERAGAPVEPNGGLYRGPYVDICPPSLRGDGPPPGTDVRPLRAGEPSRAASRSETPLVYVTLGTVLKDHALLRMLLDGLAAVDCDVLMTVGRDVDPETLAPWPANATVERYLPQAELLPRCTAVVAHGGSGSTLGALVHGLPLLLVPQAADQFENSIAYRDAGAGIALMPGEQTDAAVRESVTRILTERSYRDHAEAVAAEIAAMPSAAEVAASLA